MDKTRQLAARQGYVETHFGRRLYLPEISSSNGMRDKLQREQQLMPNARHCRGHHQAGNDFS